MEGRLVSTKGHKFSIIRGIPRFVVDKTTGFIKTEDAFSSKWKKFNKTYHEKNGSFISKTGLWIDFDGKT